MGERIVLGGDHRGFALKRELARRLAEAGFEVEDRGPASADPVDYPDFAAPAAREVSEGRAARGIVICGSGLGVMYTANRFPRVRAALVRDVETAQLARRHNDANMLALSGDRTDPETAWKIVRAWLDTPFEAGRHAPRVAKIDSLTRTDDALAPVAAADPEICALLRREAEREALELDVRASATAVPEPVAAAMAALLGSRDEDVRREVSALARVAVARAAALFGAEQVLIARSPEDAVLLPAASAPGILWLGAAQADPESGRLEAARVHERALALRAAELAVDAGSLVRRFDAAALRAVADELRIPFRVHLGGLAGLVAARLLPNPVGVADEVSAAADQSLAGPPLGLGLRRGAQRYREYHAIRTRSLAGLAVALHEAAKPDFAASAARSVELARALSREFLARDVPVATGGTDTHRLEVLALQGASRTALERLAEIGLRVELGSLRDEGQRFDANDPRAPRGLALGSSALAARGFGAPETAELAALIASALAGRTSEHARARVEALCRRFPSHLARSTAGG